MGTSPVDVAALSVPQPPIAQAQSALIFADCVLFHWALPTQWEQTSGHPHRHQTQPCPGSEPLLSAQWVPAKAHLGWKLRGKQKCLILNTAGAWG